jgi:hypothetical protein
MGSALRSGHFAPGYANPIERRRRQAQNVARTKRASRRNTVRAGRRSPSDSADEPRSALMTTAENKTKITILTGTYRVKGYIDLLPGARVTDYLIESKGFIALTDAEVWELGNRHVLNASFINVSLDHIQIVTPGG